MEDPNLKPVIRFPNFKENWEVQKLGNFISLITGFAFKGEDISEDSNGTPLLRGINITEGYIRHNVKIDRYFTGDTQEFEKFLLNENDLVIGMDGSKVGKNVSLINKNDSGSLLIQRVARLRATDNSDINFIYHNIFSKRFIRYVDKVNTSSGIPHISSKQIKDFKIGFPSLLEQQRIASFLTNIESRINLLKEKKNTLIDFKKGVMQKLFNQDIRFKDDIGNEFKDWDEKKLGAVGITLNGLTGKTKEDFGSGKPFIQYTQIFNSSKVKTNDFGLVNISVNDNQTKVQFGDILFTTSSETSHEVGMSSVLLEEVDELYLNSFSFGFRPNNLKELVPSFAQYLFRSNNVRRNIIKLAQGSTRYNMSKLAFMKQSILLPEEDEQIKIANYLTALDDKIDGLQFKIDSSIDFKKGLLQKMFV